MNKKNLKLFALSSMAFCLILTFQNCSPQFQLSDQLAGLNQATDSSLLPPVISFAADAPTVFNSDQIDLSFEVTASGTSSLRSVMCQLNELPEVNCDSLTVSFSDLEDGDYSLTIVAETTLDARAEFVRLFRKDTVAPTLTLSMMPAAITDQTTAQFQFMASDTLSGVAVVECSLDNGDYAACVSPVNINALPIGDHTFSLRATDVAGNLSEVVTYNWTINMAVPTPTLLTTPLQLTNSTSATFTFSGAGIVTFECQLDGGDYAACVSPVMLNDLTATAHTFRVRGINADNMVSQPAQFLWVVDNVAPTLPVLMSSVGAVSNIRTATFTFVSTDAVGVVAYQCSLDGAAFANCVSPVNLANLADGAHTFSVRALDGAGNISPVATFSWSVEGVDQDADNLAAGLVLYANNCASCHGDVQDSSKRNRSALAIQESIVNVPAMMGIELTPLQIEQIARALSDD
jgi:hypothetical protein